LWSRLSRGVGCAGVALACAGCLVSDPPEYEEPSLTPPFLDMVQATPLASRIIVRDRADPLIKFDVPFRSEDAGQPIWFALHRNYPFDPSNSLLVGSISLPPGTFDETDRSIRFDWTISSLEAGCYQLTLLVSHESTWDFFERRPHLTRGIGDTAMATWWLNFEPPNNNPGTLENCPTLSEVEP
jgi:hypothetical protein